MATLLDIRKNVAEDSGHYELVTDWEAGTYTDNGCNRFINAAQKWLESRIPYRKGQAWLYKVLPIGESLVTFTTCRYVEQVWLATSAGRRLLCPTTQEAIRQLYPEDLTGTDSGYPEYWAPLVLGLAPDQAAQTAETLAAAGAVDTDLLVFGNHHAYHGIMIMPPPEAVCTIEVLAKWHSKDMTSDTDVSFWSLVRPELLVRATRLQIEIDRHRNASGINDLAAPLIDDLTHIANDMVAEEMVGPPTRWVMGG